MAMGKYYSHSRFELFETCPAAYKKKYIDEEPETPSAPLIIGKLIHQVIQEYDRHLLDNKLQTDITELDDISRRLFYQTALALGTERWGEVEKIVQTVGEMHIFYPAVTVGIEEAFEIDMDMGGITFKGIMDLLEIQNNEATIVDYKTDWRVRSQTEVNKDAQLHRYALAVHKYYPQVNIFKGRLEFVRSGIVREIEIDIADIYNTEQSIRELINRIENETEFSPQPGEGCTWCSYTETCPALKNLSNQIICVSLADAAQIVGELAILEKQVADRKKALQPWCNKNGSVSLNGISWGYFPSITQKIKDAAKFITVLKGADMDPSPYLSVDMKKAKKLLNNDKVGVILERLAVNEGKTTFKSKKLRGDDEDEDT
jgi:RecB family exonuclease